MLQRGSERLEHAAVVGAAVAELGRVGALEAVDRLLLVADDEDRARNLARAGAGEELARERLDHAPLRRARVLRLVDENVVDAAVEAPEHPGGGAGPGEQRLGAVDEVVEVEEAGRRLAGGEGGEPAAGEAVEDVGAGEGGVGDAQRTRRRDAVHQGVEFRHQPRVRRLHGTGGEFARLGGEGGLGPGAEEKHRLQRFEGEARLGGGERGAELFRRRDVAGASGRQRRDDDREHRPRLGGEDAREEQLVAGGGLGAEGGGEAIRVVGGGEAGAVLHELEQQRVDLVAGEAAGHFGELARGEGGDPVEHLLAQRAGLAVLEHREARGDAGLEREAAQQRLAEGVDRLDLQPAGSFERAGEEGAGGGELGGRDGVGGLAELGERAAERGVVEHRPAAEGAEQAVLHLGRGGLGVGEAEDALRIGAGEEQAGDAVGEHAGLARAGVGRDPARRARGRGADLRGGGLAHHRRSGGSPSAHSPLRDRWS